jgi:glycosyltransferase involved in cell wall biosynthesis
VTVVTHEIEPTVEEWRGVDLRLVRRPLESFALGEWRLEAEARRAHRALGKDAIVLSNGGNYTRANVSWVHSVHAVWPIRDAGAPIARRAVTRIVKAIARRREARTLRNVALVLANSQKTADDLARSLAVPVRKLVVLRFGAEGLPGPTPSGRTLRIGFVGALGWDSNKGLDTALRALTRLTEERERDYRLVVAGFGSTQRWERMATRLGVRERVEFLGMVRDVPALMQTFDLLVSPARYEAYGLAIQEALLAGVPVLVSSDAGIAKYLDSVPSLLVHRKEDPDAWLAAMRFSLSNLDEQRLRVSALRTALLARSWTDMASELSGLVESRLH